MDPTITELLVAARHGNRGAHDNLFGAVYDELRGLARRHLRRGAPAQTLQTTALVHEAYLRLFDPDRVDIKDRGHFFALASRVMRHVLVDHFRRKNSARRGGGWSRLTLESGDIPIEERGALLVALDAALERLARIDERQSKIVECRFFGGMTEQAIADVLGVTDRTVRNDWVKARAWLMAELGSG